MINYEIYIPDKKERRDYYFVCFWASAVLGILFYGNILAALPIGLFAIPLEKKYIEFRIARRKERLLDGFREVLYVIAAAAAAGRQMPYAVAAAAARVSSACGEDSDIAREMNAIVRVYEESHGAVDELLTDFGMRSGIAEITQFAAAYGICKRSGGDLEDVCIKSANILLERIAFRDELRALTEQKKFDIALLVSLPIIMLIFLNLTAPSYISPLYGNPLGILIMTGCLVLMAVALLWSIKIVGVEI